MLNGNSNTVNSPSIDNCLTDDDNGGISKYVWKTTDVKGNGEDTGIKSKYTWKCDDKVEKNHAYIFPRNIRALIVGKSESGKTTLLMHLLLEPDMLDYDTLTVCGNSLHQSVYKVLNAGFTKGFSKQQVSRIFDLQDELKEAGLGVEQFINEYDRSCGGGVAAQFLDNVDDIPDPIEYDPTRKNLLVLDDVMLGPQNKAEAYYTRGRQNNVDTIYISQNYFRLPRQTVRENANIIMLFKQDAKNLNHIYQDHCTDISFEEFSDFCNDVWSNGKHHFVTINLSCPTNNGKYRRSLRKCWIPSNDLISW